MTTPTDHPVLDAIDSLAESFALDLDIVYWHRDSESIEFTDHDATYEIVVREIDR